MNCAKCLKCDKSLGVLTSEELNKYWIDTIPYFNRGFLLCYDCQNDFSLFVKKFIQPERSKREDLNCENCKGIPRAFMCCGIHKNDESCNEYKFKIRCSENCANKQDLLK